MLTYQDYLKAQDSQYIKPRIKVEWLYADFTVEKEITDYLVNASGSMTVNLEQGARRSLTLTLRNIDKSFLSSINTLWFAQPIKLWLGLEINGEDFFIPQGVFYITNPTSVSNLSNKSVNINAVDKWAFLNGTLFGNLDAIYDIPVTTNIYTGITKILNLPLGNGRVIDSAPTILTSYFNGKTTVLPNGSIVNVLDTPYSLTKARSSSNYGEILTELASMIGGLIYYNVNGNLIIEPSQDDIDDNTKGSIYDFTTEGFNYLGASMESKFTEVYNSVIVIGDTIKSDLASAKSQNTNVLSPTCIQRIGEKLLLLEISGISSDEYAQISSDYELKRRMILQQSISIESVPIYDLDVNKVITLFDDSLGLDKTRFLIQSLLIPFKVGDKMQITATSVNDLAFS